MMRKKDITSSAHITEFIAQYECEETHEEIFVALLDNGKIRIGYAGGPIKDFPALMVEHLVKELATAVDFDTAEDILIDSEF